MCGRRANLRGTTRSLAKPLGYQWLRGEALPLQYWGQPCDLVKLNPPLNYALRLRAHADLPDPSNTTKRRPDFMHSRTSWEAQAAALEAEVGS